MDEATLTVTTSKKARIVTGLGALHSLPRLVGGLDPYRVAVIADSSVPGTIVDAIVNGVGAQGFPVSLATVKGGEAVKSLDSIAGLWRFMADSGLTRESMLIAVGGGALLDASGFAAATYMRGIMLAYVPTTTLAQVDAAVGGKNGVNLDGYKNLVGTFHHPDIVVIDPGILTGLPQDSYAPGFAEVVKHAAIKGGDMLSWLKSRAEGINDRDPQVLDEIVRFSVSVKLGVIERDYAEKGYRVVLNYGHTVGHAVEAASGYTVSHGYAVSMGLAAESKLAVHVAGLPEHEAQMVADTLTALRLPTRIPIPGDKLVAAMRMDKKFTRGKPRIPLPRRLGDFEVFELEEGVVESRLSSLTRG